MALEQIILKKDAHLKQSNFRLWIALKHHKTHKGNSLDFEDHQYLRDIYADNSDYMVIKKSTQCGITEYLIVRGNSKAIKGQNIFYVLPTYSLVSRFVRNRIDKTIGLSKYYKQIELLSRQEQSKRAESMTLKDIGKGCIAFVGSNSTAAFTEFPADEVIIDELDECDQENIVMASERLAHSQYGTEIKVANPTIESFGIDNEYKKTNKMEWYIKHDCGGYVNLDWFNHIVRKIDKNMYVIRDSKWKWDSGRDIYPICDKCNKPIRNRKIAGEWIEDNNNIKHGYKVTKLFSGNVSIVQMLERFQEGLIKDNVLQRFYNADLGQAFTAEGSKVTRMMIEECIDDYAPGYEEGINIAGVDVGSFYHYVIMRVLPGGRIKTLTVGKVRDTESIINILSEYKIKTGIIDAMPETRESRKISTKFNLLFLCYFGNTKSDNINIQNKTVTVQRTPALDAVKEALLTKTILYPKNILSNKEFVDNMTASVRVFNPDKRVSGSIGSYNWVEGSKDDHYFLATAYALIARRLLVLLSKR